MSTKKSTNGLGTGTLPPIPPQGETTQVVESIFVNPFILPGDDQIFRMREEEKLRKEQKRQETKKMHVWEKNSEGKTSRTARLNELVGEGTKIVSVNDAIKTIATEAIKMVGPRRAEKENMTEYIAKKREMFLVQMSLDTKREEIRKLEEKAKMKEEALQRSEQMLEEDAMRFDAFLKENDKKAHDAIKRAEEETKRKQEKTQEIKRLTQQIQALSSEMSKHRESLEDCMRYKQFLDLITPPEHFEAHAKELERRRLEIQKQRFDKKYKEWEVLRRKLTEQHRKDIEAAREAKKKDRSRRRKDENGGAAVEEEEEEKRLVIPPPPKLEDEIVPPIIEEPPMYFTEPSQLMDIFAALEEQNLFLIQNSQETEHTLEELQHAFKETKEVMESRTGVLQEKIDELHMQISSEEQKAKTLQAKRMMGEAEENQSHHHGKGDHTSQQEKEKLLGDLNAKVRQVYEQCGFDASSKPSTLFMLSQLECRLEALLLDIEKMPQDYVIRAEKEKEKKRREKKREEQQALQIRLQEERNKRAIERSMQAPKKRVGRPVMSRSRPVKREIKSTGEETDSKDDDEQKFLA